MFSHNPSNWSIDTYGKDYYSSGLVPYWRGGLLGSFEVVGSPDWSEKKMAFTASYAPQIERGGMPGVIPIEWAKDKIDSEKDQEGYTYSTHPHPFTAAVSWRISAGLEDFGYLDIFAFHFGAHFKRYM